MTEKPILFSGEMVRAILEGRKTQTRRVVKLPKEKGKEYRFDGAWKDGPKPFNAGEYLHLPFRNLADGPNGWEHEMSVREFCPHGNPGDLLWVRETWRPQDGMTIECRYQDEIEYRADGNRPKEPTDCCWKPSIFMPRWASRITLEIIGVRVERLQDISSADAIAEGVPVDDPIHDYQILWDSINGKRPGCSWLSNPFVWAISFRRV